MQLDEDYWTNSNVEAPHVASDSLVSITSFSVDPHDCQFGVYPIVNVPDALNDILQFDAMKLFVVLDGAKIEGLAEVLEGSGLPFQCLYKGNMAEELRDVAPYLVELQADSALLRQTFTRAEGEQYWWDLGAAIYLQSAASLEDVAQHLRKLVALKTDAGKVQYLRFWDAPILHRILAATSAEFLDPLHFFGSTPDTLIQAFILPDPTADIVAIAVPRAQSPQGRLSCTPGLTRVLKTQAREAFAITLIAHCAPRFPKTIARLPEPAQRDLMLAGIEEARGLNITKRGPVTSYTEMRLVLGAGMVDDPMYPWVAGVLGRVTQQNQMAAMEALVSRFAEYNTQVNGAGNAHFYAALTRARAALDAPEEKSYLDMLDRVYPEKVLALGNDSVQSFLTSVRERLATYPNLDPESIRAFILQCFFMGHRCAEDPQYDWIAPTLARSAENAAGASDSPLVRKSKTWSDAILEMAPKQ